MLSESGFVVRQLFEIQPSNHHSILESRQIMSATDSQVLLIGHDALHDPLNKIVRVSNGTLVVPPTEETVEVEDVR